MRYKAKVDRSTCDECFFEIPNFLFCFNRLQPYCRDDCFTVQTVLKWVLKIWFMVFYSVLLKIYKEHNDADMGLWFSTTLKIDFDDVLIVYAVQHFIFWAARPIFFCIFCCSTACLDQGKPYSKLDQLDHSIISYNYIEYTK